MANITKLYDTPPYQEQDSDSKDYKKKLLRHRAGKGAKYLIGAVVVLCGCLVFNVWSRNKTYTTYETVATVEHSSTVNTLYTEYNGKLLKYSRDGISCIGSNNEAIWSQTYNMQNPMVDICQSAVANRATPYTSLTPRARSPRSAPCFRSSRSASPPRA